MSGTVTAAAIAASNIILIPYLVYAQVPGEYKGVKLPYAAGQARKVTGTHASNRRAIDFGMKLENILAIKSGTVTTVTKDQYGGKYILVDHGDGFCALYLHLDSFNVKQNDSVKQGQVIGVSGNTGLGGQYHLHLAVLKKINSACTANNTREIAMVFDEKPDTSLGLGDNVVSQNGGSPAPSENNPNNDIRSGNFYTLVNKATNKALDAGGANSNAVYMHENPNQGNNFHLWKLEKVGDFYLITNKATGKALDAGGANSNAVYPHESPNPGNNFHLWKLVKTGDSYLLISKATGKALDAGGANGDQAYMHENPNSSNNFHLWRLK